MDLSIIINHYKTPHLLKLCLEYLHKNLPADLTKEIIVVDSESQKETKEMLTEFFPSFAKASEGKPSLFFLPFKENVGFGKIVNAGIKNAKGEYILILNADIIIHKKETVPVMIDYLKNNPTVGLLGPRLLNFNSQPQDSCFRFYTPAVALCRRTILGKTKWGKKIINNFLMKDIDKTKPIEADWLMGSAYFTKKEIVEKVGLFDERFFMYFEDVDWCRRFSQAGYKIIYFPLTQIYHYHMQASKKGWGIFDFILSKYARIHFVSAIKYFWKWRGV